MEWKKDSYIVSDDSDKLDLDAIHRFLTNSYWMTRVPAKQGGL